MGGSPGGQSFGAPVQPSAHNADYAAAMGQPTANSPEYAAAMGQPTARDPNYMAAMGQPGSNMPGYGNPNGFGAPMASDPSMGLAKKGGCCGCLSVMMLMSAAGVLALIASLVF
jgi:hypothetical protein